MQKTQFTLTHCQQERLALKREICDLAAAIRSGRSGSYSFLFRTKHIAASLMRGKPLTVIETKHRSKGTLPAFGEIKRLLELRFSDHPHFAEIITHINEYEKEQFRLFVNEGKEVVA